MKVTSLTSIALFLGLACAKGASKKKNIFLDTDLFSDVE